MNKELRNADGLAVRLACRKGQWREPTAGLARGYAQANLVVMAKEQAFDFLLFCQRNPKSCPLLDVTDAGSPVPELIAEDADVRTDVPRYCVYRNGTLVDKPTDISNYWNDELHAFLLGCSFTFENALLAAGIPVRHIESGCNVPMYETNIPCRPAGIFQGEMVVSMRPMTPRQAIDSVRICARFPTMHGTPIHIGDPEALGIADLDDPDFGDKVEVRANEIPVFWACGVTPQAIAMKIKAPLLITHMPGHMFVTDLTDGALEQA